MAATWCLIWRKLRSTRSGVTARTWGVGCQVASSFADGVEVDGDAGVEGFQGEGLGGVVGGDADEFSGGQGGDLAGG